jgi:hypothetical protein
MRRVIVHPMMGITLYSTYAKFPEDLLRKTDPPLAVKVGRDEVTGGAQYVLGLQKYTITLTRMQDGEIPKHLAGFAGFIRTIYGGSPDKRGTQIIQQLQRSKLILGVIIEPDGADINLPLQVVYTIAAMTKSTIFINGHLMDYNDNLILAPNGKFERKAMIDPIKPAGKPWYQFW